MAKKKHDDFPTEFLDWVFREATPVKTWFVVYLGAEILGARSDGGGDANLRLVLTYPALRCSADRNGKAKARAKGRGKGKGRRRRPLRLQQPKPRLNTPLKNSVKNWVFNGVLDA